jgi:hypothetical protein
MLMSATTLPLVAAMLLMATIEIDAEDCNGQGIYPIKLPFCAGCVASHKFCFDISNGKSALYVAEDMGHSAIVNALRAAGAH